MSPNNPASSARPPAPPADETLALRATDVSFSYGTRLALENVSLDLPFAKVVAIVGPNGCGKSTLLKLLCGQLAPRTGSVCADVAPTPSSATHSGAALGTAPGPPPEIQALPPDRPDPRDLTSLSPADIARLVALVPQSTSVGFDYSVRQIVLMARWAAHARAGLATALGFETPDDHRIADEAMWAMDVHHLADRPITQLSGGERQRAIIARALAQQTPTILLDEPANSLDLWHQLELFAHLGRLAHQERKAVLIVTHDLNHALVCADQVVLMDARHVVAAGPPAQVLTAANLEPVYRVSVHVGSGQMLAFTRKTP